MTDNRKRTSTTPLRSSVWLYSIVMVLGIVFYQAANTAAFAQPNNQPGPTFQQPFNQPGGQPQPGNAPPGQQPPGNAQPGPPPGVSPPPGQQPGEQPQPPPKKSPEEVQKNTSDLPTIDEMPIPSAKDLLTKPPVDWLVIDKDKVMVVNKVFPRPHTLVKLQEKFDESFNWPKPKTTEEREQQIAEREELNYLVITIPGDKSRKEFRIRRDKIESIVYHEELMLRRAEGLMAEEKFPEAYEFLYMVTRVSPKWPGLKRRNQLIKYQQASSHFKAGRIETAFMWLERVHVENDKYPQLSQFLGACTDKLVSEAVQDKDYRQARHFLSRLRQMDAQHPSFIKWAKFLNDHAVKFVTQARNAYSSGDHPNAVYLSAQAADVWPVATGLADVYRRATRRYQILNVGGVDQLGGEQLYPIKTRTELRHEHLMNQSLFEIDRVDGSARYYTNYFENWEPTELGRRISFNLRQRRANWESRPQLTAPQLVSQYLERIDPDNPLYDERLSHYIASLSVQSPFRFEMKLSEVPLRPEAVLNLVPTLGEEDISPDSEGNVAASGEFATRFRKVRQDGNRTVFRRAISQRDGLSEYHVAEVNEISFPTHEEAIRAIIRDDVSFLPYIRPEDVSRFQDDEQFEVRKYALPVNHVLQFNFGNKALQSRELRRAIAFSLNREKMMEEVLLERAGKHLARIVTAPYYSGSDAYNPNIEPRKYDIALSLSLKAAAQNSYGGVIPPLKMLIGADPLQQAVAQAMVKQWKRIGLEVELITPEMALKGKERPKWDLLYRSLTMTEPATQMWTFLTLEEQASVNSLSQLPDWLRQPVLDVESAVDFKSAQAALRRLHQMTWSNCSYVPLWEVDEFMVYRRKKVEIPLKRNIRGQVNPPMHAYDGIEQWTIQPWYATTSR